MLTATSVMFSARQPAATVGITRKLMASDVGLVAKPGTEDSAQQLHHFFHELGFFGCGVGAEPNGGVNLRRHFHGIACDGPAALLDPLDQDRSPRNSFA